MRVWSYILGISSCLLLLSAYSFKHPHQQPTPYPMPQLQFFPPPLETDNLPTVEGVVLGRYLFYDPILSKDSTLSCATCHQQAFAFSDGNKTFSTGVQGTMLQRNTLPLFNLAWYQHLSWDGKASSIEQQL